MAISQKVESSRNGESENQILSLELSSSLGATGVGRQPCPHGQGLGMGKQNLLRGATLFGYRIALFKFAFKDTICDLRRDA